MPRSEVQFAKQQLQADRRHLATLRLRLDKTIETLQRANDALSESQELLNRVESSK